MRERAACGPRSHWLGAAGIVSILAACGDSAAPEPPVVTLRIEPDSVVVYVDSTVRVRALALDAHGDSLDRAIAWLIFDTTVARVSDDGAVTGVTLGFASLIAASDSVYAQVPLTTVVRFVTIAPGTRETCALAADGRPYCWGLSIGIPRMVPGTPPFADIVSGDQHRCARTVGGDAWCWGGALPGDGGDTVSAAPRPVIGGHRFSAFGAGLAYSCGLTVGGEVFCWGSSIYAATGSTAVATTPQPAAQGLAFQALTAKLQHACGLTAGGEAYCWGYNRYGQLGSNADGPCVRPCSAVAVPVQNAPAFTTIEAGNYHTCALTPEGEAWCWGDNWSGQLGDTVGSGCHYSRSSPPYPCSETPVRVRTTLRFATLAAGEAHTCALDAGGLVYCWGDNSRGQFGDGSKVSSVAPVPAAGGLRFITLRAAYAMTCGIAADGVVYCWGDDWFNGLGNGHSQQSALTPIRILNQP